MLSTTRQLLEVALHPCVRRKSRLSCRRAGKTVRHRILAPKATHPDTAVDGVSKEDSGPGRRRQVACRRPPGPKREKAADRCCAFAAAAGRDMYHDALGTRAGKKTPEKPFLGAQTRLDKARDHFATPCKPRLSRGRRLALCCATTLALLACGGHKPGRGPIGRSQKKAGANRPRATPP